MNSSERANRIQQLNEPSRARFLAACCERAIELYAELAAPYDRRVDDVTEAAWAMAEGVPPRLSAEDARAIAAIALEAFEASLTLGHVVEAFAQAAEYVTTAAPEAVRLSANNLLSAVEFATSPEDGFGETEATWQDSLLTRLTEGEFSRAEITAEFLEDQPEWVAHLT